MKPSERIEQLCEGLLTGRPVNPKYSGTEHGLMLRLAAVSLYLDEASAAEAERAEDRKTRALESIAESLARVAEAINSYDELNVRVWKAEEDR